MQGIFPVEESRLDAELKPFLTNGNIAELNIKLKMLCDAVEGCNYIDPSPLTVNGQLGNDFAREDGLHLSREGYAVWRSMLRPLLAPLEGGFCRNGAPDVYCNQAAGSQ